MCWISLKVSSFMEANLNWQKPPHLSIRCAALERTPDCFRIVDTIDPPQEKYRVDLEEIHRNRANWDSLYTPAYGAILSNNWTTISETLDAVLAELGSLADAPAICHIDLHPHNILVDRGRVVGILDFDAFKWASPSIMYAFGAFNDCARVS